MSEIKCPICHQSDMVYPCKIISDYGCLRCCCLFDGKKKKKNKENEE